MVIVITMYNFIAASYFIWTCTHNSFDSRAVSKCEHTGQLKKHNTWLLSPKLLGCFIFVVLVAVGIQVG